MSFIAPDVNPEPIRPPRLEPQANLETFGGGQGLEQINQQAQNVARDAGDIASFEKIKADHAAVEEAMGGKVSPYVTQTLYDPENGALARIGRAQTTKEALQIHDQANADINDFAKKTAGNLSGGMQIGSFVNRMYPIADNVNKTLMAHVDQRGKKLYHDAFESGVDNITAQAALGNGMLQMKNAQGVTQQDQNIQTLHSRIDERAAYDGMTPDEKTELESKVFSNYHSAIVDRMLADGQSKNANAYFQENKGDIQNLKIRETTEKNLVTIPKQQEELAKYQKDQAQDANLRSAMVNALKGNLSSGEAVRMFMNDEIDKSGFSALNSIVSKPDYQISKFKTMDAPGQESDPATFNQLREAQLNHKFTPGELTRQILDAHKDGKLSNTDGVYLDNQTKALPPSPRDTEVNAAANYVRSRLKTLYDPGTSVLGSIANFIHKDPEKEGPSAEIEGQVAQFYKQADKTKVSGDDLKAMRDQIVENTIRKKYPGIPAGKLPDVMLTVSGKVIRLLNGDEKSEAKPRFKITPTPSQDVDQE